MMAAFAESWNRCSSLPDSLTFRRVVTHGEAYPSLANAEGLVGILPGDDLGTTLGFPDKHGQGNFNHIKCPAVAMVGDWTHPALSTQ